MTNREWLQSLSDEEFAKWSIEVGCGACAYKPERGFCNNLSGSISFKENYCIDGTAKWLQMEHKGDKK